MITEKILPASIALSSLGLTVALGLQSHWITALLCAIFGLLWMATLWAHWDTFFSSFWLVCQTSVFIAAYLDKVSPFLILICLLLCLCAWDLQLFIRRLEKVKSTEASKFEKRHLIRLGAVLGSGLVLSSLALLIHFTMAFWLAFVLSVVALYVVYQAFTYLTRRKRNDSGPTEPEE